MQYVHKERNIRFHTADSGFLNCADRLARRTRKRSVMRNDFYQKAVIKRRDFRTCMRRTAVQTDAVARGRTVHADFSGIRQEVVRGVLRCNTNLYRIAVAADFLLRADADFRGIKRVALFNQYLRLHDINARNGFCHCMLYLYTGVHFDKVIVFVCVNQKFQRTGIFVANVLGKPHCVGKNLFTDRIADVKRRSKFHNLLVPPLHGTVPVKQMHNVAVFVAQNLHLDMLGVAQVFFYENLIITKRLFRLVPRFFKFLGHLRLAVNDTHTASAAAVGGFQHNRITDPRRNLHDLVQAPYRMVHAGNDRHIALNCHFFRRNLIAHRIHDVYIRSDERNARLVAGVHKIRVFGKEAIAGVDCVNTLCLCYFNDIVNIQICVNRSFFRIQHICLVCFCAEQGIFIFFGKNTHRLNAQLVQCTVYANRDFSTVCHQHLFELPDFLFLHIHSSFVCVPAAARPGTVSFSSLIILNRYSTL